MQITCFTVFEEPISFTVKVPPRYVPLLTKPILLSQLIGVRFNKRSSAITTTITFRERAGAFRDARITCIQAEIERDSLAFRDSLLSEVICDDEILYGLSTMAGRVMRLRSVSGWPMVASTASVDGRRPWSAVIAPMNETLSSLAEDSGVYLIDTQQALHVSSGGRAPGALSAIRMRAPFEEVGFLALAREGASAIAHFFGRGHRALLTDWDNTLWGGEVGEVEPEGVELGPETPDGYGYQLVQGYIRDLNGLGVALAAVSRNDPQAAAILDVNPHMQLRRENFAAVELSGGNKSDAVSRIVESLNFGADFLVYIDDNHVDLAEVVSRFPEIDVVLAGPDPDQSLHRLAGRRFFNSFRLTAADINRQEQLRSLRDQREAMMNVGSKEEFLASLAIEFQ